MKNLNLNLEHVCAVILAAGSGSRMNTETPKQYISVRGESVLKRSVRAFSDCADIHSIVVVCRPDDDALVRAELADDFPKLYKVVSGGNFRAVSAKRGFEAVPSEASFVAIHDAARCLISPSDISRVVHAAKEYGAATAASPITNTVKVVDEKGFVVKTLPRCELLSAETPQIFGVDLYKRALSSIGDDFGAITDDNMLVESIGERIYCVPVTDNIKITTRRDLDIAEFILSKEHANV